MKNYASAIALALLFHLNIKVSMKNFMNTVKIKSPGRSMFDLSHDVKFSCDAGFMVPTLAMEILPGDTVQLSCNMICRFAPMLAPIMHKVKATTHYWFVPNRILWPEWETFITNKITPPGTPPAHPYLVVQSDGSNYTRLMDYMGIPKPLAGQTIDENINALPFMAYQKVWAENYADQTIQANAIASVTELADGNNTANESWLTAIRVRAWNRDFYTSCLPTPQHGVPVEVPIRTEDIRVLRNSADAGLDIWATTNGQTLVENELSENSGVIAESLYVNGDEIESNTLVEDIRRASAIQRFFEKLMRAGRRYKEVILSTFGVTSKDSRLQRPEYITGVVNPIVISEVVNTTGTANAPQGDMTGHGIGVTKGNYGRYKATEHGWIIGITTIQPDSAYQNGIWGSLTQKNSYLDYFWPDFANLGEEAILTRELFAYTSQGGDTFGYLPRYSRYRTLPSRVCGDFRENLDFWHWGRIFTSAPTLEEAFIICQPGKRIFAVEDQGHNLWCHMEHKIMASRPVPKFGTPVLY